MVICVRVEEDDQQPTPKRKRAAEAAAGCPAEAYTDIKAHAMMLCARSAYFDRALSGEWAKATERRIELTVED